LIGLIIKKIHWPYWVILLSCIFFISAFSCTPDRKRGTATDTDVSETLSAEDSLIGEAVANKDEEDTEEADKIPDSDAFIRAIVQNDKIGKNQTTEVRFRLYTIVDIKSISSTVWPELDESFEVEEIALDSIRKMDKETFKGLRYNIVDLRALKLRPKKAGILIIKPVAMNVSFTIPGDKYEKTVIGEIPVIEEVKKTLKSDEVTINVIDK